MFILARHAQASWDASSDEQRELTCAGRADLQRQVAIYPHYFSVLEKVVVSPFVRTLQTAQLLAPHIEVVEDSRLTPESSVKDAISALEAHWVDNLLVVTHQPLIGSLICFLEHGGTQMPEPVMPGDCYLYQLLWPGPACAQRHLRLSAR